MKKRSLTLRILNSSCGKNTCPNHPNRLIFMNYLSCLMAPLTDLWGPRENTEKYSRLLSTVLLMVNKSPSTGYLLNPLPFPSSKTSFLVHLGWKEWENSKTISLVSLPSPLTQALFLLPEQSWQNSCWPMLRILQWLSKQYPKSFTQHLILS